MSKHEERVAYLRRVAHKLDYYPDREDVRTLLKALDKAEGERDQILRALPHDWREQYERAERAETKVKELERECAGLHADLACRRPAEPTEAALYQRGMVEGARQVLAAVAALHQFTEVADDDVRYCGECGNLDESEPCPSVAAAREAVARIEGTQASGT